MDKIQMTDTIMGAVCNEVEGHGGGKTFPGAVYPYGMVQLSPDTITGGDNGCGYSYGHKTIEGFSFTHMSGIGWYGDLGNLQVMPYTGEHKFRSGTNEFCCTIFFCIVSIFNSVKCYRSCNIIFTSIKICFIRFISSD